MTPPIGLRHFIYNKFQSCYSCTIDKGFMNNTFYNIVTCLFGNESDYLNALSFDVVVGGITVTLTSENSLSSNDNTSKGIFTPTLVKKMGIQKMPWHLSNFGSLQAIFSEFCTFKKENISLILDKTNHFNGSIMIVVDEFLKIPNKFCTKFVTQ